MEQDNSDLFRQRVTDTLADKIFNTPASSKILKRLRECHMYSTLGKISLFFYRSMISGDEINWFFEKCNYDLGLFVIVTLHLSRQKDGSKLFDSMLYGNPILFDYILDELKNE